MAFNPRIGLNYTVNDAPIPTEPSLTTENRNWKGPDPIKQHPDFVGFSEVGVRAAYEKALYWYDLMVNNWLSTFEILSADEKEVIPVTNIVYGGPERAFAVNEPRGTGSATGRITLPAISFIRQDITKVFNRGPVLRDAGQRRRVFYTDDMNKNYVEIRSTYHIVDIPYQIELLTKYQSEMQMLVQQFLMPFVPEAVFDLNVPSSYFHERIYTHLTGTSDASTYETPDGDRVLKTQATLKMEGFIPINVSKIEKTMKDINTTFVERQERGLPEEFLGPGGVEVDLGLTQYIHEQTVPDDMWHITHNLGCYPKVTVTTPDNDLIFDFSLDYPTENIVDIIFSTPTVGIAYLTI